MTEEEKVSDRLDLLIEEVRLVSERLEMIEEKVGSNERKTSLQLGNNNKGSLGTVKAYINPLNVGESKTLIKNAYELFAWAHVQDAIIREGLIGGI